ncbi:putative LuxR family transcriptional regulator [Gordonia polyisoprenivorans VH2]|uniref:Putative LuxR family transcriptional regulator n=1 Tax=Gordonia polyisoprenivorans (strain DSM 44266 / VH2) TaxID=1112204 RepID=H6N3B5_GORPV|nr:LuxR family transcriptional regulator [Gordonia polyisoprenivorans]AFA71154.1 putative LuxR family transcriptional regulator [Gordonia polyisoprenivorans VH2]
MTTPTHWTPPEILDVDDYRRAFDIISGCHDASTMSEFRESLVESLCRHLNVMNVSFFSGSTFHLVFEDVTPLTSGSTERMLPEYQERWATHDVFGSPAAVRQLLTSSVASLNELESQRRLPASSEAYVHHFLRERWNVGSAAAMQLPLAGGRTALVGLFGRSDSELGPHDIGVLRLVGQQLAPVTKRLPVEPALQAVRSLTGRQREVVKLVADGQSNAQIAAILCIAEDSVKKYVTRILHQTGCQSRLELALITRDAGL